MVYLPTFTIKSAIHVAKSTSPMDGMDYSIWPDYWGKIPSWSWTKVVFRPEKLQRDPKGDSSSNHPFFRGELLNFEGLYPKQLVFFIAQVYFQRHNNFPTQKFSLFFGQRKYMGQSKYWPVAMDAERGTVATNMWLNNICIVCIAGVTQSIIVIYMLGAQATNM